MNDCVESFSHHAHPNHAITFCLSLLFPFSPSPFPFLCSLFFSRNSCSVFTFLIKLTQLDPKLIVILGSLPSRVRLALPFALGRPKPGSLPSRPSSSSSFPPPGLQHQTTLEHRHIHRTVRGLISPIVSAPALSLSLVIPSHGLHRSLSLAPYRHADHLHLLLRSDRHGHKYRQRVLTAS